MNLVLWNNGKEYQRLTLVTWSHFSVCILELSHGDGTFLLENSEMLNLENKTGNME